MLNHGMRSCGASRRDSFTAPARPIADVDGGSTVDPMIGLIVILLIVWLVLAVLGFVIKGLLWLAIAGIILFVITILFGYIRRGGRKSSV